MANQATRLMTRRRAPQCGTGLLAAAAFPPPTVGSTTAAAAQAQTPVASTVGPIISRLSTFMTEAPSRNLPDPVVEKTKHLILDTLAAMVSGAELPPGLFAIKFAGAYGGEKVATVAGSSVLCG